VKGRGIAVFGSSEPAEGEPLYAAARRVGGLLAREGYAVITGGYGGVMEAACRGAQEVGGTTYGITTRAFNARRPRPNAYLTHHIEEEGLFERTRELIARSDGFIILAGKAGTLAELTFLWALHRAQLLGDRPIVLLGAPWRQFLQQVDALELVDQDQLTITDVVETPEEAIGVIRRRMSSRDAR
jgi:uncharacterized protein (TIGR00730 family)